MGRRNGVPLGARGYGDGTEPVDRRRVPNPDRSISARAQYDRAVEAGPGVTMPEAARRLGVSYGVLWRAMLAAEEAGRGVGPLRRTGGWAFYDLAAMRAALAAWRAGRPR